MPPCGRDATFRRVASSAGARLLRRKLLAPYRSAARSASNASLGCAPRCVRHSVPSRSMKKRDRKAPDRPVRFLEVLATAPDQHRVVDLELGRERPDLLGRVVHREAQHDQAVVLVLALELDEPRDLDLARPAPGRPEVQQDDVALQRRQAHLVAVDVAQREIERRGPRVVVTDGLRGAAAGRGAGKRPHCQAAHPRAASASRAPAPHRSPESTVWSSLVLLPRRAAARPPLSCPSPARRQLGLPGVCAVGIYRKSNSHTTARSCRDPVIAPRPQGRASSRPDYRAHPLDLKPRAADRFGARATRPAAHARGARNGPGGRGRSPRPSAHARGARIRPAAPVSPEQSAERPRQVTGAARSRPKSRGTRFASEPA